MDFGYSNDPTSLVTMYKYNDAYIFDEVIYKKGLLNSEISNLLKANNVNEIVYADSAEPKSKPASCQNRSGPKSRLDFAVL